jgi:hypothetical protein
MVNKFEVGKKYSYLESKKGVYLCTYAKIDGSKGILEYTTNGITDDYYSYSPHAYEEIKEPLKGTLWVNVYPDDIYSQTHLTRENADRQAMSNRVACIEVFWIEGQGLK